MSKFDGHTPGPWAYDPFDRVVIQEGVKDIAHMDRDATEADVMLIVAAPDLLAERARLRDALRGIANTPPSGIYDDTFCLPPSWWRALVRSLYGQAEDALKEADDE